MASINCRCGDVSVAFTCQQPIHEIECCCVDCYDKNVWAYKAGGAALPSGVTGIHGQGKPLDLRYWPNKLAVTGKEKLAFNKVRDDAASINMVTTCCSSLLCVEHPFYLGNAVLTFPEFCPYIGAGELPEIKTRVFTKDWPAGKYADLPPKPGFYIGPEGILYDPPGRETEAACAPFMAGFSQSHVAADTPGETFQALLAAAGGTVESLNLPEGANSNKLKANKAAEAALADCGPPGALATEAS